MHVIASAAGVVTPVGLEQRVETLASVQHAAAVGVGPVGTAQVVLVVVPTARERGPLASMALTDEVRSLVPAAAAVLVRDELPVDIRHQSKVDRQALAAWAADVLAGS